MKVFGTRAGFKSRIKSLTVTLQKSRSSLRHGSEARSVGEMA